MVLTYERSRVTLIAEDRLSSYTVRVEHLGVVLFSLTSLKKILPKINLYLIFVNYIYIYYLYMGPQNIFHII